MSYRGKRRGLLDSIYIVVVERRNVNKKDRDKYSAKIACRFACAFGCGFVSLESVIVLVFDIRHFAKSDKKSLTISASHPAKFEMLANWLKDVYCA